MPHPVSIPCPILSPRFWRKGGLPQNQTLPARSVNPPTPLTPLTPLAHLPVYSKEPASKQGNPCLAGRSPPARKRKTMPKLKTHSGAAKRFKKTGTGKIKRGHTKVRHILTSKAPKAKRKLGKSAAGFRRRLPEGRAHDSLRLMRCAGTFRSGPQKGSCRAQPPRRKRNASRTGEISGLN